MKQTFKDCALLTELPDLSKWDTHNVQDMTMMFMGCKSLNDKPPFDNGKQALEYAVDHKQVEVFLQPVFQKGETHPVGAEALARIRDSKGNIIAPGFFITEQNRTLLTNPDGSYTERGQDVIRQTPFGRMGKPEELCGTIHYLMSDASAFVTGTVAVVDGGFNIFAM